MQFVGAAPPGERSQDVWRVAVDLGEAAVRLASVEVRGVDAIGIEPSGALEAHCFEAGEFGFEVVHEHADVVEALFARFEHVPVDRRCVIVLGDELNHLVAEVAERIGHVSLVIGASALEAVGRVMRHDNERPRVEQAMPLPTGVLDIVDEVRLLEERIPLKH